MFAPLCFEDFACLGGRCSLEWLRVVIIVLGSLGCELCDSRFGYSSEYAAFGLITAHADCFATVAGLSEVGKAALDCHRL